MVNNSTLQTENIDSEAQVKTSADENFSPETIVGLKIRGLRYEKGFSLRALAERSGLNINTLSLIENSKSSPSVSTLQQLAKALEVPITAFFESEPLVKHVVFTAHNRRPGAMFSNAFMQNLGKDLKDNAVQPFIVTLKPKAGSGDEMIVHTGYEFVYCMKGNIIYWIEKECFTLNPGDSLVFEAHLPHRWENASEGESQIILVLSPADHHEEFGGRHFPTE